MVPAALFAEILGIVSRHYFARSDLRPTPSTRRPAGERAQKLLVRMRERVYPAAGTYTCLNGSNDKDGHFCAAAMKMARGAHTATLFSSGPLTGDVLIVGGLGAKKPNST
jgi:hypothetical protein